MTRGKVGLALAVLVLSMFSGCGWRDPQNGLLSRFRAKGTEPSCPCPPYMNGYGMDGFGASAMPCSMPGGGWPGAMPGGVIHGPMMPGAVMPGAGPEVLNPAQPGLQMPNPPGNGTAPGSATPKPADPSDGASLKKGNGLATTK